MHVFNKFNKGQEALFFEKHVVISETSNVTIFLVDKETGEELSYPRAAIESAYQMFNFILLESLPKDIDWSPNLTEGQKAKIAFREYWVLLMTEYDTPTSQDTYDAIVANLPKDYPFRKVPGKSTVCKWYKDWKLNDENMAKVIAFNQHGNTSSVAPALITLTDKVVRQHYMKRSKPTKKEVYKKLQVAFENSILFGSSIKLPKREWFCRYINKNFDRIELIAAREGRSQARAEARSANKKTKLSRILQLVEADTAHFNIGLTDENHEYYIGKPTMYFIFDAYSRSLLGYAIEVRKGGETSSGAIHAFKHAIEPKSNRAEYPMFGMPEVLKLDNGVAYRSSTTFEYFKRVRMPQPTFTATHSGWKKAFVERFIGTLRTKFFSTLNGYLGKYDPKKFQTEPLIKHAKYSLKEFVQKFDEFILEYHNTPVDYLQGFTPKQVWLKSALDNPPVTFIHNDDARMLIGEKFEAKKLSHVTGIKIGKQRFNCDDLQAIYHELTPENATGNSINIDFLVDWSDASYIKVQHPTEPRMMKVPNVDDNSKGLSFAEATCKHIKNLVSPLKSNDFAPENELPETVLDVSTEPQKISKNKSKLGKELDVITQSTSFNPADYMSNEMPQKMLNSSIQPEPNEGEDEDDMSLPTEVEMD